MKTTYHIRILFYFTVRDSKISQIVDYRRYCFQIFLVLPPASLLPGWYMFPLRLPFSPSSVSLIFYVSILTSPFWICVSKTALLFSSLLSSILLDCVVFYYFYNKSWDFRLWSRPNFYEFMSLLHPWANNASFDEFSILCLYHCISLLMDKEIWSVIEYTKLLIDV